MNAKKIMGAVLVAFLAAALFIGAGAAAEGDQGTYFAYQTDLSTGLNGVWQNGANTVTVAGGNVSDVPVAGTYTLGKMTAYFTKPTATYVANGELGNVKYIVTNGGNVYEGSKLTIAVTSLNQTGAPVDQIRVEFPDGTVEFNATNYFTGLTMSTAGTYKVQAVWNETGSAENFITGAPLPAVDANVFTFTVVKPGDATISGSIDTIIAGETISITVKGTPGEVYNLDFTGVNVSDQKLNQIVTLQKNTSSVLNFTMPNIGEVTFQFKTDAAADEVEVELATEKKPESIIGTVVIAVTKPVVTATLGAPSYFVGEDVEVTLSSTGKLGNGYTFNITGTNFAEITIDASEEKDGDNLVYTLQTNKTKLDVGTYTIKVIKNGVVATLPVAFKQPFISIAEAPEVIAQNKSATFLINAEATDGIQAYIFGTNKFIAVFDGAIENEKDEDKEPIANLFNVTLDATTTKNMATGQYFAVFQHPMYDGFFNINATAAGAFYLNTTATATDGAGNTILFNVSDRQTANAAQALCDALDSQNIDDMYVKASFFVVKELEKGVFTISEIPTTVAQGETITISGVATEYDGQTVAVEMVSTAFAAVPKETVGSAAFILVTTKVAEDGTWEVTLDTSDLNVDEYSLSVAFNSVEKESVTINVVEAADEPETPVTPEQPEQPEQPEEPVAPATPGFGALAALAGLGAVAVLLLRRE